MSYKAMNFNLPSYNSFPMSTESYYSEKSPEKNLVFAIILQAVTDCTRLKLNPKSEKFSYRLLDFKSAYNFLDLKNAYFQKLCSFVEMEPNCIVNFVRKNKRFHSNLEILKSCTLYTS